MTDTDIFSDFALNRRIAVAVSGGGDSVALYRMLLEHKSAVDIHILHFNHNLRSDAANDAAFVEDLGAEHGSPVHVKAWDDVPEGNLQQAAREARYKFFEEVCAREGINQLFLGHTQDDVLETFLMRLGKGSGLTGLASIQALSVRRGLTLVRPMLHLSRSELREYLGEINQIWREDPSNENEAFTRVRMRKLLPTLSNSGLSQESMSASVTALNRAEAALKQLSESLFDAYKEECSFPCAQLFSQPEEIQLRLLAMMIQSVHEGSMLPRTSKRLSALEKLQNGEKITLGGLILMVKGNRIYWEEEVSSS